MSANVIELFRKLEVLTEKERAEFEAEFERRRHSEWEAATAEARRIAAERGIDDETVIDAVMELRYGSNWKSR